MAFISRFRSMNQWNLYTAYQIQSRHFASILNPDSTTPLTTKQKSRAALSLLKSEKNPERIIEICRAASLTPVSSLDRAAFSMAISKLRDLNYFEGIRTYIGDLLKTRPDLKNERFMSFAIVLYGQAGLLNDAFQLFDKMPQLGVTHDARSLNSMLFACILAKKYDEVTRVFFDFPGKYGLQPNIDTYNTVIKAFCESGSTSSCYSLIAEMGRKEFKLNGLTFRPMIAGFYKEGKFDDVGRVLEMMKQHNVPIRIETYNIRIWSLCKLKRSTEAKALLEGILARGIKANVDTYTYLIRGFCFEGKVDDAKDIFKKMLKARCNPNSNCYFTLVHYLCRSGDFETALDICKQSMKNDWFPNYTSMKSLVKGLANSSKVDEAKELIEQTKNRFPKNADLWNEVDEILAK